jgi:hypothetical protein
MSPDHRRRTIVQRLALASIPIVGALALAPVASAAPPSGAIRSLPGCTANTLPANDDESTDDAIPLGFTANLNGSSFGAVYVNNNGNVTADRPLSEYTPYDFTLTDNVIIAPFLADVDTRPFQAPDDAPAPTEPVASSSLVTYGSGTESGRPYFCVDWVNVGYYSRHAEKVNSFQLVLWKDTDPGHPAGSFDIEHNYGNLTWESGDASGGTDGFGGTSAAAGYSSGDGDPANGFLDPRSFSPGATLDTAADGLIHGSRSSAGQPGRYVFQIRPSSVVAGRLTGTVRSPDGNALGDAPVEVCRTATPVTCVVRTTDASGHYRAGGLAPGQYRVTGHAPSGTTYGDRSEGPVTVAVDQPATQDITLGDPARALPPGTEITSTGTTDSGSPVLFWQDPVHLTTQACSGGTGTFTVSIAGSVVGTGTLVEDRSTPGSYTGDAAPLYPQHGTATFALHVSCPGAPAVDTTFEAYIDPSGTVVDTANDPVVGATVRLLRSTTAAGPFVQVPEGSALMSPGNRVNPTVTGNDGVFGWDVVAGYYRVEATKDGCVAAADRSAAAADSGVLTIPPAVTGLKLRLFCGETPAPGPDPGDGSGPGTSTTPTTPTGTTSTTSVPSSSTQPTTGSSAPTTPGPVKPAVVKPASVPVKVAISRATALSGRRVALAINASAPGKVAVVASVGAGKRRTVVLTGSAVAKASGAVKITLKPTARGRLALRPGRSVRLAVRVTFTDANRRSRSASRTLSVKVRR